LKVERGASSKLKVTSKKFNVSKEHVERGQREEMREASGK
jgi:hypothetical protein